MSITIEATELKKELQNLQQGEFRLGYVYVDDIVHLTDVFKVIDRLAAEKDCNTCAYIRNHGVCKHCYRNYPDQYTKHCYHNHPDQYIKVEKKSQENAKDCDRCFGASFNDCEICDERGEEV